MSHNYLLNKQIIYSKRLFVWDVSWLESDTCPWGVRWCVGWGGLRQLCYLYASIIGYATLTSKKYRYYATIMLE